MVSVALLRMASWSWDSVEGTSWQKHERRAALGGGGERLTNGFITRLDFKEGVGDQSPSRKAPTVRRPLTTTHDMTLILLLTLTLKYQFPHARLCKRRHEYDQVTSSHWPGFTL